MYIRLPHVSWQVERAERRSADPPADSITHREIVNQRVKTHEPCDRSKRRDGGEKGKNTMVRRKLCYVLRTTTHTQQYGKGRED